MKVNIEIDQALLNKLAWALPSGTVEQRVEFVIKKAISRGEYAEGITYPSDAPPCRSFEHVEVKT